MLPDAPVENPGYATVFTQRHTQEVFWGGGLQRMAHRLTAFFFFKFPVWPLILVALVVEMKKKCYRGRVGGPGHLLPLAAYFRHAYDFTVPHSMIRNFDTAFDHAHVRSGKFIVKRVK